MDSEANPLKDNNTNTKENQVEKLGYVYRHIRLDTNMPFYIGISTVNDNDHKRSKNASRRSKEWKDVVSVTEYRVDILLKDVPVSIIGDKEKYFIKLYGRIDRGTGTLVNKTSGGQGSSGSIISEETRKKRSELMKGNIYALGYKRTPEQLEKSRLVFLGKTHTEETKRKLSKKNKGKTHTEETLKKMRGKKHTPERIEKNRQAQTGKKLTQETKNKLYKKIGKFKDGNLIKEYPSAIAASVEGFCNSNISACCNGKIKSHKGFQWKFL